MPITWDEAYDEIVRRLDAVRREDGADAVAFFPDIPSGTVRCSSALPHSLRVGELRHESSVCFDATFMAWAATTGSFAVPDLDHAATYIGWGYGPPTPATCRWAGCRASGAGGRLLIVDPKITPAVKMAVCTCSSSPVPTARWFPGHRQGHPGQRLGRHGLRGEAHRRL